MRIPARIGLAALLCAASWAQTSGPAFEVVSVKEAEDGMKGIGLSTYPGGRVEAHFAPLDYLISQAYDVQRFQISGGPQWIHDARFDIIAKPPAASKSSKANPNNPKLPPNEEQKLMLQALLADRFGLVLHHESKEGPVYLLVKTNKPLRMTPAANAEEYPWVGSVAGAAIVRDGLRGTNATMKLMAQRLSERMGGIVLDRTGIEGAYDFQYSLAQDVGATDLISSIMLSVQGLGLKLEAGRAPIESLVIDRVEKPKGN
jgi:uncharacterized protein (TIGR03435 family)